MFYKIIVYNPRAASRGGASYAPIRSLTIQCQLFATQQSPRPLRALTEDSELSANRICCRI